jgi:hypothetical protein
MELPHLFDCEARNPVRYPAYPWGNNLLLISRH